MTNHTSLVNGISLFPGQIRKNTSFRSNAKRVLDFEADIIFFPWEADLGATQVLTHRNNRYVFRTLLYYHEILYGSCAWLPVA